MAHFIAVHHTAHATNFTYKESIEEAREYLIGLITAEFSRPDDTMAIVSSYGIAHRSTTVPVSIPSPA